MPVCPPPLYGFMAEVWQDTMVRHIISAQKFQGEGGTCWCAPPPLWLQGGGVAGYAWTSSLAPLATS